MDEQGLNPYQSPGQKGEGSTSAGSFSISTLLLTITLIAVLLAFLPVAPGVSLGLAVLCVPAYVRVALAATRHRGAVKLSMIDKVFAFIASLITVLALATCFVVCCFVTCTGAFWIPYPIFGEPYLELAAPFLTVSVVLGTAVGGFIVYVVGKRIWPFRQRPFYERIKKDPMKDSP